MGKVVTFGTLREDIVIEYDFSVPMEWMEIKVNTLNKSVGGSVNNTCNYLALMDSKVEIVLCTLNYADLVEIVNRRIIGDKYRISVTKEALLKYPVSIIGLREDGEKQMISYDPIVDDSVLINLLKKEVIDADVIYTSFYEISERNYGDIVKLFNDANDSGRTIMIDLCPVINKLNAAIINEILANTTVISGNEDEYRIMLQMTDRDSIIEIFRDFPVVEQIFVKQGEKGASVYKRDTYGEIEEVHINGVENHFIKNTTGCGDVFNAVVIEGLVNNKEYKTIIEHAVNESGKVAEGGLPWIKK